jgi:hypothetical protein
MILDDKARAALRDPSTRAVKIELTPELKAKYSRVSGQVVDLLMRNTTGPVEAYMILKFVSEALEARHGIRAGLILHEEDPST